MDMKTKKDLAVDFINTIRTMEPTALNALIVKEAGEELAQFFLNYSANLISEDPSRVLENTSSLMLMGYLIRSYEERTGHKVGFKPAGGIRTAKQALEYEFLMKEELGDHWLKPDLFRLGASALLTDIERQLEHFLTGRYSAAHRHPMV